MLQLKRKATNGKELATLYLKNSQIKLTDKFQI